jgi:hypothetical protein
MIGGMRRDDDGGDDMSWWEGKQVLSAPVSIFVTFPSSSIQHRMYSFDGKRVRGVSGSGQDTQPEPDLVISLRGNFSQSQSKPCLGLSQRYTYIVCTNEPSYYKYMSESKVGPSLSPWPCISSYRPSNLSQRTLTFIKM